MAGNINAVNTSLTGQTGSGKFVGDTSPTLVTPALGTPSSGNLSNCTGFPTSVGLKFPQGRLTLTTGVPVTTSDVTGASAQTVYFSPFMGNIISLFDGSVWNNITFSEISIAVPASTSQMYDVFCYDNSGTATLELLAWTNDTTRATDLTTQDGVYVKNGDATRLYLGSMRTGSVSGQSEDSVANRFLWNYYNRVLKDMIAVDGTNTWNYSTATWRQANANTANQLNFIIGVSEDVVRCQVTGKWSNSNTNGTTVYVGVGVDVTNAQGATLVQSSTSNDGVAKMTIASWVGYPGIGKHFLAWLEIGKGSDVQTWFGDGGTTTQQSGIMGIILC